MSFILDDGSKYDEVKYDDTILRSDFYVGSSVPNTGVNVCYYYNKFSNIEDVYDINSVSLEYDMNYTSEFIGKITEYNSGGHYEYNVLLTNVAYTRDGTITPLFYIHTCLHRIKLTTVPKSEEDLMNLVSITNPLGFIEKDLRYVVRLKESGDSGLYYIEIYTNVSTPRYTVSYSYYSPEIKENISGSETLNPQRIYFMVSGSPGEHEYSYTQNPDRTITLSTAEMEEWVYVNDGARIYIEEPDGSLEINSPKFPRVKVGSFNNGEFRVSHDAFDKYHDSRYPLRKITKQRVEIISANAIKLPKTPIYRPLLGYDVKVYYGDNEITDKIVDINPALGIIKINFCPLIGTEKIYVSMFYADDFIDYDGFKTTKGEFVYLNINPRFGNWFSDIFPITGSVAFGNMLSRTLNLIDDKVIVMYLRTDGTIFHTIRKADDIQYTTPFLNCWDSISFNSIIQPQKYSSPEDNDAIILGTISIPNSFSETTVLDSRRRGGGIKKEPTDDPDGLWWDYRSFSGESYTSNGVFIVKVNTNEDNYIPIMNSVDKYKAIGTLPIVISTIEKSEPKTTEINNHFMLYDTTAIIDSTAFEILSQYHFTDVNVPIIIKFRCMLDSYDSFSVNINSQDYSLSSIGVVNNIDHDSCSITFTAAGIYDVAFVITSGEDSYESHCIVRVD